MVVGGGQRGSNMVVGCSQRGGNMVVGGGQRGGNMVVGGGQRSGNMVVGGGQRGGNTVIGGSQGGSNSIGGSKRSVVDKSWVSLSLGLTLDNMLNSTVLGNIRWTIDTIGHSGVVVGAVVAGHSVAGKSMDKGRSNSSDNWGSNSSDNWGSNSSDYWGSNSSDNWGSNSSENWRSNSPDKWGSKMAIRCQRGSNMAIGCQRGRVGRSKRGTSIRAVDESWVSLSFSLTLGNKMPVVESVGGLVRCVRSDKRGGRSGVRSDKRGGRVGVQRESMSVGAVGMGTIGTIGGDVLSICLGFRLSHSSGDKSENYKHLHGAGVVMRLS